MDSAQTPTRTADPSGCPPGVRASAGRLLALSTAGAWSSVARLDFADARLESESLAEPATSGQSARLLSMIGELVEPAQLGGGDGIDAIAFDAGPGAFTGLRVGCAVAQGLGFARGLPLIPVGSLEAAAWASLRRTGAGQAVVLVASDARMGEIYVALCAVQAPQPGALAPSVRLLVAPRVERPDAAPAALSRDEIERTMPELRGWRWLLAGDAWHGLRLDPAWFALAGDATGSLGLDAAAAADARDVAELGLAAWQRGEAVDAALAAPRYVRDKVALDAGEQRRLRESRSAAQAGTAESRQAGNRESTQADGQALGQASGGGLSPVR